MAPAGLRSARLGPPPLVPGEWTQPLSVPVAAVAHAFDRAVGSVCAFVQAVLDRVPRQRFLGDLLSNRVNLSRANRCVGRCECSDHCSLDPSSAWLDPALCLVWSSMRVIRWASGFLGESAPKPL